MGRGDLNRIAKSCKTRKWGISTRGEHKKRKKGGKITTLLERTRGRASGEETSPCKVWRKESSNVEQGQGN